MGVIGGVPMLKQDGDTAKVYRRYLQLQTKLETDEEYMALMGQREAKLPAVKAALEILPEEQRAALIAYLGLCAELENRAMEIACAVD